MKRYAVIAAMVALVAFGLAAFAQEKPAEKARPASPAIKAPMAGMKVALQLTPEQEAKLKEFQKARQTENQAFGDQMKKLREDMQALRQADKPDSAKMNGLIDQIFKLQAERAKAGIKNAQEREKIFTPEQLEKMKNGRMGMRGPSMGMAPGMGMRSGMMMRGRMGMRPGMGMQMGMRPGMMRDRMGMRPGMGMRMGMRPGMMIRGRVGQEIRRGLRMGMRRGMGMQKEAQPEPKR
jgi:Spy/CpxP family protein refolding chaperone